MDVYEKLKNIAKANKLELTENAYRIAMFREKTKLALDKCPCAPLDEKRGCIGEKCWEELNSAGICHCGCFRKV